jgi:ribose transport system ATP-binding protein
VEDAVTAAAGPDIGSGTGERPTGRLALAARHVSKTFAGRRVLTDFCLDIGAGEIHALLGENGSGKSTFIKILSGFHEPDRGASASIYGRELNFAASGSSHGLGCRFVHQDLGLIESESILDNLAIGNGYPSRLLTINQRAARRRATEDLTRIGLDLDTSRAVGDLSPAERTGVAVARALHEGPDAPVRLLVLDEPTATLPDAEVRRLHRVVRAVAAAGVGVLYVTHRLEEVFSIAQRFSVLRDGRTVAVRRVDEVDRAQLVKLLVGDEFAEVEAAAEAQSASVAAPILEVHGLRTETLQDVSFVARGGEVLGVAGISGSGSEALLGAVFGALPRHGGQVTVRGRTIPAFQPRRSMRAGLAFVPADRKRHAAMLSLSLRENLTIADLRGLGRWGQVSRRAEARQVQQWVSRLSVRPSDRYEAPLATFSGGNQQKVMFARALRLEPDAFLLDEPTQGVDVGAKAQLHACLLEAASDGRAVVVACSDIDELTALCHRVIVLRDGRVVAELEGATLTVKAVTRESLGADRKERGHDDR